MNNYTLGSNSKLGLPVDNSQCSGVQCPGNPSQPCGGISGILVYKFEAPAGEAPVWIAPVVVAAVLILLSPFAFCYFRLRAIRQRRRKLMLEQQKRTVKTQSIPVDFK